MRMRLLDAADLVRRAYGGPTALPPLRAKLTKGAQAYLTMEDVLVIPGTNEFSDWTDFNLKAFSIQGAWLGWDKLNPWIGAATWHMGFAQHALEVAKFLNTRRPKFVIGHSLGAASAQILGTHYQVPTVTFAAPRPMVGKLPLPGEGWVVNFVHADDVIGLVLEQSAGFRRLGGLRSLVPEKTGDSAHSMPDYIKALQDRLAKGDLAPDWPPMP